MDYSRLYRYLNTEWPARQHTDLIETLAHELADFVFQDQQVEATRVRLSKLDVYLDDAVPSFEIYRVR
jgi:dihydroneopterin aldolase